MGKGDSSPKVKNPPNLKKSYQQGVDIYLQNQPALLAAEQQARGQYDPQRIAEQQALQTQYGPTQYQQMLDAYQQLDPAYANLRTQTANTIGQQEALGSQLDPASRQQIQQYVRGRQAATGNTYGGAADIAEAYALGDRGQQLQQQRIQNAEGFLKNPSIPQLTGFIPPVSADRSSAYINPNAGFQGTDAANAAYQNQLGAAGLRSQGGNQWGTTLSTIGQLAGVVGLFASDKRLKKNIKRVGKSPSGAGIYEFAYKHHVTPRYRGAIAQNLEKFEPSKVYTNMITGLKSVHPQYAPVRIK